LENLDQFINSIRRQPCEIANGDQKGRRQEGCGEGFHGFLIEKNDIKRVAALD
jgi:hypothetical protein